MIDSTGRLIYKPEFEHESLHYKMKATSGAFVGARLNVLDDDPLDAFARQKLDALQKSVKKNVKWLRDNVTSGRTKAWDAYDAVATPAKKRFREVVQIPSRVNERLEKENRAIKSELELTQLRLAEARIRVEEARLLGREYGVSAFAMAIWVCVLKLLLELDLTNAESGLPLRNVSTRACLVVQLFRARPRL